MGAKHACGASGLGRATRESLGYQAKDLVFAVKARENFEAGGLDGEKVQPGYSVGPAARPSKSKWSVLYLLAEEWMNTSGSVGQGLSSFSLAPTFLNARQQIPRHDPGSLPAMGLQTFPRPDSDIMAHSGIMKVHLVLVPSSWHGVPNTFGTAECQWCLWYATEMLVGRGLNSY